MAGREHDVDLRRIVGELVDQRAERIERVGVGWIGVDRDLRDPEDELGGRALPQRIIGIELRQSRRGLHQHLLCLRARPGSAAERDATRADPGQKPDRDVIGDMITDGTERLIRALEIGLCELDLREPQEHPGTELGGGNAIERRGGRIDRNADRYDPVAEQRLGLGELDERGHMGEVIATRAIDPRTQLIEKRHRQKPITGRGRASAFTYTARVGLDGKAWVRLAQLRGRIATLARGGRYESAARLLGELTRADLALGLPADALLRARQGAALAEERGDPTAGPLVVLAATLLSAGEPASAIDGAQLAIERATPAERPRIEIMARLVGGSAQRRLGRLVEARLLLDAARGAAARLGEAMLAGFALAELAWVDHAEAQPAAAATCLEFAAEFFRRVDSGAAAAVEADALALASWAAAGEMEAATARLASVADNARKLDRPELVAFVDGAIADLSLAKATEAAAQACALAAESAQALPDAPLSRDLRAQARLRQVRTTDDALDRERHLEAGIEIALTLDRARAGARLGAALVGLLDDATVRERAPLRSELSRLGKALSSLGDPELAALADSVLAELS